MTKAEAFLIQARNDFPVCMELAVSDAADCNALHYLQMCAEKLTKALKLRYDPTFDERTHRVVKHLPRLLSEPAFAQVLGWSDYAAYLAFLETVRPALTEIEELCPAVDPPAENAEYPWQNADGDWIAPSRHAFHLAATFNRPWDARPVYVFLALLLARFDSLP